MRFALIFTAIIGATTAITAPLVESRGDDVALAQRVNKCARHCFNKAITEHTPCNADDMKCQCEAGTAGGDDNWKTAARKCVVKKCGTKGLKVKNQAIKACIPLLKGNPANTKRNVVVEDTILERSPASLFGFELQTKREIAAETTVFNNLIENQIHNAPELDDAKYYDEMASESADLDESQDDIIAVITREHKLFRVEDYEEDEEDDE